MALDPLARIGLRKDEVKNALLASRVAAAAREKAAAALPKPKIGDDVIQFVERTGAKVVGSIVNLVIEVSPALAADWLERNHNNRKPSMTKIRRFAALMTAGKWTMTGEPVKFTAGGELLDGQSRLQAIVEAKVTVPLEVRWGLPRAAQESMDTGEARTHAHQLQMLGTRYPNEIAAALRIVWGWEHGSISSGASLSGTRRALMTNTTIRETLERHPRIAISIDRYGSAKALRNLIPLSRAGAFHYLFSMVDEGASNAFWDQLASGSGLVEGSPVHLLRERLMGDRLSQAKIQSREQFALVVKAWNAVRDHTRLARLNFFNGTELFPEISGLARKDEMAKS